MKSVGEAIGEWCWDRSRRRLRLDISQGPLRHSLNGEWSLPDLAKVVDGLSSKAISDGLDADTVQVSIDLRTADGDAVHLAGAAIDDIEVRGVVLSISDLGYHEDSPGAELTPVFQPIINLRTQGIAGFEALARWEDGIVRSVEALSDVQALASNMLIKSAEALVGFRKILKQPDVFVQVNVTSIDLVDDSLARLVSALIDGYGLGRGTLRLELTEQAALRDTARSLARLRELKASGAGLVLDDFGSGHSSFLWLAELPADSLKVDASLIRQVSNPRVETILEALTLMARRLNMTATAEGVETTSILPKLSALGFDFAQGYALGRPLSVSDMEKYLRG